MHTDKFHQLRLRNILILYYILLTLNSNVNQKADQALCICTSGLWRKKLTLSRYSSIAPFRYAIRKIYAKPIRQFWVATPTCKTVFAKYSLTISAYSERITIHSMKSISRLACLCLRYVMYAAISRRNFEGSDLPSAARYNIAVCVSVNQTIVDRWSIILLSPGQIDAS